MNHLRLPLAAAALIALSGCAGMSETQQRTLSGGALGATGGAVLGAISGNVGLGAAAGAGAGVLGGYLYDQYEQTRRADFERGYQEGNRQRHRP